MRWAGLILGVLECAACSSLNGDAHDALFGGKPSYPSIAGSAGGAAGLGGASNCSGDSCGGASCQVTPGCPTGPHAPPCAASEKECAGLCVDALPENGCADPSCTPCPSSEHGVATCFGERCGIRCDAGFVETGSACQAPPAGCADSTKNGTETDVDCGGMCPRCESGKHCLNGADCVTAACVNGTCATASCSNGVQDSSETDMDCGGPGCDACANGLHCRAGSDCMEGSCIATICQASTCDDRVRNGRETGIDCGGSCAPCGTGSACAADADCASSHCIANKCRVSCPTPRNKQGCPECTVAVAQPCCRTDDFCGCALGVGLVCNL